MHVATFERFVLPLYILMSYDALVGSTGLTMLQMWQLPRASGLRGPPEVKKIFSARQ